MCAPGGLSHPKNCRRTGSIAARSLTSTRNNVTFTIERHARGLEVGRPYFPKPAASGRPLDFLHILDASGSNLTFQFLLRISLADSIVRVLGMHERTQIKLNIVDRAELEAVVANQNSPQKHVWRARSCWPRELEIDVPRQRKCHARIACERNQVPETSAIMSDASYDYV